jgi:hypothetical protein
MKLIFLFFRLLNFIVFIAGLLFIYVFVTNRLPHFLSNGEYKDGINRIESVIIETINHAKLWVNKLRNSNLNDAELEQLPQPKQPEFDLQELAPLLHSIPFRTIESEALMNGVVHLNACESPKNPKQAKISVENYSIYVLKSASLLQEEKPDLCSEYHGKPVLIFERNEKIIGYFHINYETLTEGVFSVANIQGKKNQRTLIWSVHSGGANMKFEHYLIDIDSKNRISVNIDFNENLGEGEFDRSGNVEIKTTQFPLKGATDSRGRFLTLPKRALSDEDYKRILKNTNEKFSRNYFVNRIFERIHDENEPVYVLLQMDGSRVDFTPLSAERYVYKVIEWQGGTWRDASQTPVAQAFYRAAADSIFRELSVQDGEIRNWMLASWASYKALIDEWPEAKEIVNAKLDASAARRQMCEMISAIWALGKDGSIDNLKIRYVLNESRGKAKEAPPDCEGGQFIEFLENELKHRGFLIP